jgi:hypothetical protein
VVTLDGEVECTVPGVQGFDPDSSFELSVLPVGTWLKPVKWNQEGSYDLVGLFKNSLVEIHHLHFVQISNASAHYADLKHFLTLAVKGAKLCMEVGVEIVVVSPVGKSPTVIILKNDNLLNEIRVDPTQNRWLSSADTLISRYYFQQQI